MKSASNYLVSAENSFIAFQYFAHQLKLGERNPYGDAIP